MAHRPPPLLLLAICCCFLLHLLALADAARVLASQSQAPEAADALLKLKSGIKDPNGALASWAAGTIPCGDGGGSTWAGVMCDKDVGVHGLQLEKMGLSGTLDLAALKPVRGLRSLSFMDNAFAGPMPGLKQLGGLRAVFLSGNRFSGPIPGDAFAGMGSLKKVVLSQNGFSGPVPASLADAPKLLELRLDGNKFQGRIPDLRQTELKDVDFANNGLEGEIPAGLKSISPDKFAGNKKLCGAPLDAKCEAPASPSPKQAPSEKAAGMQPAAPADDATSRSAADDAVAAQEHPQGPTERSVSTGVLGAFLGTLAVVAIAFLALQRRRREYDAKNFGPAGSTPPTPTTTNSNKVEPHPPNDSAAASPAAAAHHVAPRGAGEDGSSRVAGGGGGGSSTRKGVDQGRLTYVRDDRGRFFELQDLLKATAEVLGTANLGVCYRATLPAGHSVVVKRFKEMNWVGREDFEEHMRRLGRLSHPNLLPLVAYYYRKEEKLLIHDYVPNRSLANLLHATRSVILQPF
ncbi:hypothetical protein PR202_gb02666 [Eleusine coracana subsp. coracana]|uniref:Protein kinase domain-containing protein n=1 Tax=Eleusine coracana subsp. coracana TaxID=191504 RepID=A0AAV5DZP5_ELECO|nr:hypothetical protein PR202_gb02666 [Eleusine coracana subsp. coracana]